MKFTITTIAILLISNMTIAQVQKVIEEKTIQYEVIKMKSKSFDGQERTVKIALPKDYSSEKQYPVVYTLDGSSMFDMVTSYTQILGNQTIVDGEDYATEVIPPSIVVGIFHIDRGLETEPNFVGLALKEGPMKLKNYIFNELVPFVNENYAVSGYNAIIGHSNTAYFTTRLLFEENNPFRGTAALSLVQSADVFNDKLMNTLSSNFDKTYFLGAGVKDNDFNWLAERVGEKISAPNVVVGNYISNHTDLPAAALNDAIRHLFYKYRNFEEFPTLSQKENFDVAAYIDSYKQSIKNDYGISVEINLDDFGYFIVETVNKGNVSGFDKLMAYEKDVNNMVYPTISHFHYRKGLKDYDEAKRLAYKMMSGVIENDIRFLVAQIDVFTDFFTKDLNDPEQAISFLEEGIKKHPDFALEFNYFIAKTANQQNSFKKKGKASLKYCKKNFKENRYFKTDDLEKFDYLN